MVLMKMRLPKAYRALVMMAVAFLSLLSPEAEGQTNDPSCTAVEQTEGMRTEGRYREARARLLECVNAQCGGDVRRRCAATLQKLDAVTPSIVVRAEDELGNDVTDVAVALGDEPLVSSLDGMAIPVDPGEHRFVFRRPGYDPVTQTLTIQRGEKFRSIDVQFGAPPPDAALPAVASDGATSSSSARWVATASLIGVGVVGLAGFTWLGLKARSQEKDLEVCKPECSEGSVDGVRQRYVMANVSGAVGVVALGAATYLLLTAPASDAVAQPADEGLAIGADSNGAFASFSGRF
jgi:hypothetical protein